MKTIPDVVDADTSLVTGKPELRVEIDRARAADLGVQGRRHRAGFEHTGRGAEGFDL